VRALYRDGREHLGKYVRVLSPSDDDRVELGDALKGFDRVRHGRTEELLSLSLAVRREPGVNAGFRFVVI